MRLKEALYLFATDGQHVTLLDENVASLFLSQTPDIDKSASRRSS
jgi:hypothetical protein